MTLLCQDWADLGAAFYSLTLMAFNLQTWPRHNACADGAPAIVLMGFLVLVPLVLVKLWQVGVSSTLSTLNSRVSERYFPVRAANLATAVQAQYIMKRLATMATLKFHRSIAPSRGSNLYTHRPWPRLV